MDINHHSVVTSPVVLRGLGEMRIETRGLTRSQKRHRLAVAVTQLAAAGRGVSWRFLEGKRWAVGEVGVGRRRR